MCWRKMIRTPLLLLALLGTSSCDHGDVTDDVIDSFNSFRSPVNVTHTPTKVHFESEWRHKQSAPVRFDSFWERPLRHETSDTFRHSRMRYNTSDTVDVESDERSRPDHRHNTSSISANRLRHAGAKNSKILSDVKYLRRHLNKEKINFVVIDELVDGEMETRVHYNGITAKETSVGGEGGGIKLRQLTDGGHLVQVIYNSNGLVQDCEYVTDTKTTRNFLKTLRKELKLALEEQTYKKQGDAFDGNERFYRHFGNMTLRLLKEGENLPPNIKEWLDYDRLKMDCLERHEELKYMMANRNRVGEQTLSRSRRSFRENLILPGTKWCGAGQLAENYSELGDDRAEDRCCRAHDHCRANIPAFGRRFGLFNFRPYTVSHCSCDRRKKRDATELLRVPGTKWCGKGFSATHYSQLGGYTRTDRCCRVHDLRCPFWIGGMEKKYGLYNWRVNTLMHCRCDERFRACLKLADTSVSNMVGKLFFNVVQTKCFILKPVKMCTQRSWWGKCLRREYMKQAFLRENLPY